MIFRFATQGEQTSMRFEGVSKNATISHHLFTEDQPLREGLNTFPYALVTLSLLHNRVHYGSIMLC